MAASLLSSSISPHRDGHDSGSIKLTEHVRSTNVPENVAAARQVSRMNRRAATSATNGCDRILLTCQGSGRSHLPRSSVEEKRQEDPALGMLNRVWVEVSVYECARCVRIDRPIPYRGHRRNEPTSVQWPTRRFRANPDRPDHVIDQPNLAESDLPSAVDDQCKSSGRVSQGTASCLVLLFPGLKSRFTKSSRCSNGQVKTGPIHESLSVSLLTHVICCCRVKLATNANSCERSRDLSDFVGYVYRHRNMDEDFHKK